MKRVIALTALFFAANLFATARQLKIGPDERHIVYADGKPFLWLGDTAWELFHRLTREEADMYLENRAEKGFTVIQAVALAELDGLNDPNAYGEKPLIDNDPTKPNEAYFKHVDYIVNKANELGMFVGMLPTWGDKFNKRWGVGPVVFNAQNAYDYGQFLGERYKNNQIIWILGGDRNPESDEHLDVIRSMAQGIHDAVGETHIFTYHPMGASNSSNWFHGDEWLDLNMFQSGHGEVNNQNYKVSLNTYQLHPPKPVVDGEPCYEDHPVNWKSENGWFDEFDSRRAGWWSMLSGACGHTYGNHNIWQMWQPGRAPISAARTPWREAVDYPGAFQAGYMRTFFEKINWQKMEPDADVIKSGPNTNGKEILAAVAKDGSFVIAYSPYGMNFNLDLSLLKSVRLQAQWFNPRNNTYIDLKDIEREANVSFDPPSDPERGNDWVLIVRSK